MTNKEVVLALLKAIDNNDTSTVKTLLGEQYQYFSPLSPAPLDPAGHIESIKGSHDSFSEMRHEPLDVIEAGNKVTVRGIVHGRHTGELNGIPPTGNQLQFSFMSIAEVEGGKLHRLWSEMNGIALLMQVGALPAPAAA